MSAKIKSPGAIKVERDEQVQRDRVRRLARMRDLVNMVVAGAPNATSGATRAADAHAAGNGSTTAYLIDFAKLGMRATDPGGEVAMLGLTEDDAEVILREAKDAGWEGRRHYRGTIIVLWEKTE